MLGRARYRGSRLRATDDERLCDGRLNLTTTEPVLVIEDYNAGSLRFMRTDSARNLETRDVKLSRR